MPAYFGLDIGSSSIKLIELNGKSVRAATIMPNPVGKAGADLVPAEKSVLVDTVKKLLATAKPSTRKVVVSIPELLVYTRVMQFPLMSTPELATAIKWEAEQVIPYPIDKMELSWVVLFKPKDLSSNEKMKVLVVGVPTKVSEAYIELLDSVGLEAVRVENELVSLVRATTTSKKLNGVTMICDIGYSGTRLVVADTNQVYANYNSPLGGMAFTKIIADTFHLTVQQAEEYKRAYGLDKSQFEGKLYTSVEPVLTSLLADINKVVAGYLNSYPDRKIDRLVLVGGGAYLKGLLGVMVQQTGLEVFVGNAFDGLRVAEALKGLGTVYAGAVGCAIDDES